MIRVTASKLALFAECQFFARAGQPWVDRSSDDAATGSEVHRMLDGYLRGLQVATEDPRAAVYFAAAKPWVDANRRTGMHTEVAFAWEPSTDRGRELPEKDGHRDYSDVAPTELAGTADIVCMGIDDAGPFVAIDDWKVSIGPDVLDASAQLGGLALFAARAYGVDRARVRTLKVTERGVDVIEAWLDEFDLCEVAGAIQERVARIESSTPAPGVHCAERWCPAIVSCPATQKDLDDVEQIIPVDALVKRRVDMPLTLTIQSPDHAADILARVRAAGKALDLLKGAVSDYVGEGVKLSDGDRLEPTFRNVSRVSSARLEQLARDKGASDEDIAMCVSSSREGAGLKIVKDKTAAKKGRAA